MKDFDPGTYGPVFEPLLQIDRRRPLGAGVSDDAIRKRLAKVTEAEAFAHARIVDAEMAGCCLSGLWLLHDFLDEAHTICQAIDTPSGGYWHAVMHRREGDFSNSKYWFRRVGAHEVFSRLGQRAAELAAIRGESRLIGQLITGGQLDPFAFVDAAERVERGAPVEVCELCLDIQQAEWELLFDWCYRRAIGGAVA